MFGFSRNKKKAPKATSHITTPRTKSLKSAFGLEYDTYVDVLFKGIEIYNEENPCRFWHRTDAKIKWRKTFLVFYKGCLFAKINVSKLKFDTTTVFEYAVSEWFYNLDKFPVMTSECIRKTICNLQDIIEAVTHRDELDRNQTTWQEKTLKFLRKTDMPISSMQRKYPIDEKTANVNKFIDNYGV